MVRLAPLGVSAALLAALPGCQLNNGEQDLVAGKQAFVQKCGSCHTLKRAGTTGVTGPNLDEAFVRAREDGFGDDTFEGVVHQQILYPNKFAQIDPQTGKALSAMPADLVTGDTAYAVAAYVAEVAGTPGKDSGRLAEVGVKRSNKVAKQSDGKLDIPADPSGALAYEFGAAEGEAGPVTIASQNRSQIDHNIAVDGQGIDEKGPVVKGGATSEISVELESGDYEFYCSVPGHREGGMVGKLTVK